MDLLNSFSSPLQERVGRVLLVDVVRGAMDVSERRRLCSRCVNSTSLRLPRVMKNSGNEHVANGVGCRRWFIDKG